MFPSALHRGKLLKKSRITEYFCWLVRSGSVSRKSFRECGPPAALALQIKAAGCLYNDPTIHKSLGKSCVCFIPSTYPHRLPTLYSLTPTAFKLSIPGIKRYQIPYLVTLVAVYKDLNFCIIRLHQVEYQPLHRLGGRIIIYSSSLLTSDGDAACCQTNLQNECNPKPGSDNLRRMHNLLLN